MISTFISRIRAAAPRSSTELSRVQQQIEKQRKRYYLKNNLLSVYALVRLLKNPKGIQYFIAMGDAQDNIGESERRLGRFTDPFKSQALEQMWQSRFDAAACYDIATLAKMPPETLGGAFARRMQAEGLGQDFYEHAAPRHRMQFLRLRMRQTHDIWHTLTGLDTDEFGEIAIQGFVAGQYTSTTSAITAAGVFLRSIFRGRLDDLEKYIDAFCEGYVAGKRAESLLSVKWEELWHESLETLRQRYRIESPRHGMRRSEAQPVRRLKEAA
jgi:ubiquinone biosynthesis protein COQ4